MFSGASSLSVFCDFIRQNPNGSLDVSGILSRECFVTWLRTRNCSPRNPAEAFRRAIVWHYKAAWGRKPFPRDVEKELLKLLRKRAIWPCFQETKQRIGIGGFRSLGFWERLELKANGSPIQLSIPVPDTSTNRLWHERMENFDLQTVDKEDYLLKFMAEELMFDRHKISKVSNY